MAGLLRLLEESKITEEREFRFNSVGATVVSIPRALPAGGAHRA